LSEAAAASVASSGGRATAGVKHGVLSQYSRDGDTRRVDLLNVSLFAVACIVCFASLIIVLAFNIWAPAAMVHETFGVHYTAYLMLSQTYYFVRNAHFFTLLYTFLPNFVVHSVFASATEFAKFQLYSLAIYFINGLVLAAILARVIFSRLPRFEKALILIVAGSPTIIVSKIVNPLTINYQMLEIVIFVVMTRGFMLIVTGLWMPSRWHAVVYGACAAVAVGTKLSLVVICVPFLLVLSTYRSGYRSLWMAALAFLISGTVTGGCLLIVYLQLHLDYVLPFVRDLLTLSTDPSWLDQDVPALTYELTHWVGPSAILFGFWILVLTWGLSVACAVWATIRLRRRAYFPMVLLSVGVAVFVGYVVVRRTAPHSIYDAVMYTVFDAAILASLTLRRLHSWTLASAILAGLLLAWAEPLLVDNPIPQKISGLTRVSEGSRAIAGLMDAHPDLPIVYYVPDIRESLIFPSVHLYPVASGDRDPLERVYMATYQPRASFRTPSSGVLQEPHVMVVPEYVPAGLDSSNPQSFDVFRTFAPFSQAESDPSNECQRFAFAAFWSNLDLQFATRPTTVTVCVITSPPVPRPIAVPPPVGSTNLALGRPATESSTIGGGSAEQAVEGDFASDSDSNSMAQTDYEHQPWWQVDLGSSETIDSVEIWNRKDCCQDRLRSLYVLVADVPFASSDLIATLAQPGVSAYYIGDQVDRPTVVAIGRTARHVRIQLTDTNYLALAEVAVWHAAQAGPSDDSPAIDLALGQTAMQSSTIGASGPGNALDGTLKEADRPGPLAHTQWDQTAWWQVDLGSVQQIGDIDIWNRADCCTNELADFYVFVSDLPFATTDLLGTALQSGVTNYWVPGDAARPTRVAANRSGRYVRLQRARPGYVALAQVQVFQARNPVTETLASPEVNLALSQHATQSSSLEGSGPENAIDGIIKDDARPGPLAHTQYDQVPWWEVDIGSSQDIGTIDIWNRSDCCGERLANFYVLVSDEPLTSRDLLESARQAGVSDYFVSGQAGRPTRIDVRRTGRYVRIQPAHPGYLALAQVQVWKDSSR
jgi:hypothetical protein